jgi:hypothetical protein
MQLQQSYGPAAHAPYAEKVESAHHGQLQWREAHVLIHRCR